MGLFPTTIHAAVMKTPSEQPPLHCLLATDLSPRSLAHVAFGARLAERLGGHTTLFHAAVALPLAVGESLPGIVPALPPDETALRRQLAEVAATLVVNRPVRTDVAVAASARQAILAAAKAHRADLLMLPTHGRSGASRALLGSVAEDVVRHAHLPTLLLTDRMVQQPLPADGRFVLAPVAEDADATAVQPAAAFAQRLGAPLLLMSVLPTAEPPPYGGGAPVAPVRTPAQARIRERLRALRELAVAAAGGLHAEVFACLGDDPAAAIVQRAGEGDIACIVVGTHARTGLARAFRGSVAESVARHAATPVVLVPPTS